MRPIIVLFTMLISGCNAGAAGQQIQVAPAPLPGYTCFTLNNAAGDPVSLSCVKD